MGNSASAAVDDEEDDDLDQFDGIETLGYRVLGVQPNSPASKAGLVSFLDFIVGANGEMLLGSGEGLQEGDEYDDVDFPALLQENKGKPVELLVWNIKALEKRVVELIPRDDWGGAGLLGVTIKLDNYGGADERLLRVLEVDPHPSAPANLAGLVAEQDFLLGTTAAALGSPTELAKLLKYHAQGNQVLELYVYNTESDVVRVVSVLPTTKWGNDPGKNGLLGAQVGTGYLHRLPHRCRSTTGQSVERKVKWVGEGTHGGETDQATDDDEGLAVIEPQLEMERSESGNMPEDSHKQPHELGHATKDKESSDKNKRSQSKDGDATSATDEADDSSASVFSSIDLPPPPKLNY